MTKDIITRRALMIEQTEGHPVYMFTLTGDELLEVASISRVTRGEDGKLIGYQRPEVKKHVDAIVEYLDGDDVLFPNAIIVALNSSVRFKHQRGPGNTDGVAIAGVLEIPLTDLGEDKPGWIVDGQQRTLALSKAKRRDIAVPVIAFVADTVDVQRDQFVRINSARPLPSGLVTELLPEISIPINPRLAAKKLPSALVEQLSLKVESPFCGMVKRASSTTAERKNMVVTDTSLVLALEESLASPAGCLFPYRNVATGETDIESIWSILIAYWSAVQATFPDAWGKPPTQSRLMHGVGIRSMSRLMDRVMSGFDPSDSELDQRALHEFATIAPYCHWTSGTWDELSMRWNEFQNVPKHVRLLSNHLVRLYMQHRQVAR